MIQDGRKTSPVKLFTINNIAGITHSRSKVLFGIILNIYIFEPSKWPELLKPVVLILVIAYY